MGTAATILLGIFIILIALTNLGLAIPPLVLGVIGLLTGIMVIALGVPLKNQA